MSQHAGRSGAARGPRQRNITIAIVAIVGLAAFIGGFALARMDDGNTGAGSSTPSSSRSRTRSPSASASASVSASASTFAVTDGRYFVQSRDVEGGGGEPLVLAYDLAYFYTGDQATQIAEQRGDPPPESGYYIVNDNPRLRAVPIADDATVRYIPETACCDLVPGTLDAWAASVSGTAQTDYPDPEITWWWITVSSGAITSIEQQYLP